MRRLALIVPLAAVLASLPLHAEPEGSARRDPFLSILAVEPDVGEPRTALEKVPLEQLTLAGLVVGTATPKAMFQTPDGRGHFVRLGDSVGKNRARISRISPAGVTLVEEWRDALGRVQRQLIELPAPAARRTL